MPVFLDMAYRAKPTVRGCGITAPRANFESAFHVYLSAVKFTGATHPVAAFPAEQATARPAVGLRDLSAIPAKLAPFNPFLSSQRTGVGILVVSVKLVSRLEVCQQSR